MQQMQNIMNENVGIKRATKSNDIQSNQLNLNNQESSNQQNSHENTKDETKLLKNKIKIEEVDNITIELDKIHTNSHEIKQQEYSIVEQEKEEKKINKEMIERQKEEKLKKEYS